jgi:broad specificity phosphatase PhoE
MTDLLLVRHGETDWNASNRFQGHADPGLNAAGREQARTLAEELADERVDAVYTSDLARARETADIIARRLGVPVVAIPELREIDVGEWEGLTHDDVEQRWPGAIDRWRSGVDAWNGGETYEMLAARVLASLRSIAAGHPRARLVVVGHGGTIRVLRAHVEGLTIPESRARSPAIGNCQVYGVRAVGVEFRGLD